MIERGKKIYLCRPDLTIVTVLNGVQTTSATLHEQIKDYAEISFNVDKFINTNEGRVLSNGYELLDVYLYLYLEDIGFFQMQYPKTVNDGNKEFRQIVAYSIDKEWSQKKWVGLKVNTGEKDSVEALVDGNTDELGYAKEFVKFYNPSNHNLSLIHLMLTKMQGWTVRDADIDPLLWSKKIRIDEDDISMYALATNVVAPKADCLIMFDSKNRRIKAYSRTNLDSYHYDTNIFIGYRNLAKQIDIDVNEDSVFTRFSVNNSEKLDIRDVNYNDTHIYDYSYFLRDPYMPSTLVTKIQSWASWRDDHRDDFAELSLEQKQINREIYDVQYRVPTNGSDWTQWDGKSEELLEKNLDYYNAVLTTLQISVDPDPQYDQQGNYIPWKTGGEVDHDRYLEALAEQDNGYGGYYTYYEILNYTIPNIEAAIENGEDVGSADYVTAYETDWQLYGIEELEAKRRNYEGQLESLSAYSKRWVDMTAAEKALYINDSDMYLSNGRQKYLDIQALLGSENTRGSLLYTLKTLKTKLSSLQAQLETVTNQRNTMVSHAQLSDNYWGLTADEIKLIDTLTYDTTYTNDNIFATDVFTDEEIIGADMELLNDAVEKLSEVSQPQYQFAVSLDNLLQIPEFKGWRDDFSLLNYFRLGTRDDYSVKLRMTGYTYNPCEITNDLKIEFSNMISSRSGRSDLTNLINDTKGGKTGGSVTNNSYSNALNDQEYLTSLLGIITRNSTFKDSVNGLVGNFVANNATIDVANINALSSGYIRASDIDVDQITGNVANFFEVNSEYIDADVVVANSAAFQAIETTYAKIDLANIDTAHISTAKVKDLFVQVGLISDAVIDGARITGYLDAIKVNANNITAGRLNAGVVEVVNLNADNITVGTINGQRIANGAIGAEKLTQELSDTIDATVANTQVFYALSSSSTTVPDTGWSEQAPDWQEGMYMWQKTVITHTDGTVVTKPATCISGAQGANGEDATILRIDSSRGTVFKNSNFGTVFTVVIWRGATQITTIQQLRNTYGVGAYLEWKWKRMEDSDFHVIPSSDSRISQNGFRFEITPDDVDEKIVFQCDLNI